MVPSCPCFAKSLVSTDSRTYVVRFGYYKRVNDHVKVPRYRCKLCKKTFSDATSSLCFGQKKRHLNRTIFELLVGGMSLRRIAIVLGINRKTVVRKFLFLGGWAQQMLPQLNTLRPKVKCVEFDDLETFEHTKYKPLSVTALVESKTRWLLGHRVSIMPAKGLLAKGARRKYGYRKDERGKARRELFTELAPFIAEDAVIKSDKNPHYPNDVKKHFPKAKHKVYESRRGCVVGQGELKRGGFDPIFSLNHTYAMLRANINRLFRRTWCTTKIAERLSLHIAMYSMYHNLKLLKKRSPKVVKLILTSQV